MNCLRTTNFILLAFCCISCCALGHNEIIYDEDRPYEVINFKVPSHLWKQAISPTPVLKSPATVVIPIQVSDEEIQEDGIIDEENEVETQTIINDETIANTSQAADEVVSDATTLANVTESPVLDETQAPEDDVPGQGIRFPCSCVRGQCGCCTGMVIRWLRMNACGNITFVPEDFVFDVRMSVNNQTVVRRRVSASDPPPVCFNLRRLPFVTVCAEISNIRIRNRNAYACLDINADIGGYQVYGASFRCFGLGMSGVQTGMKPKPISSGPPTIDLFGGGSSGSGNSGSSSQSGGLLSTASNLFGARPPSFLEGVANGVFGGGGGDDDDGPLGAIGDAVGDIFGGGREA